MASAEVDVGPRSYRSPLREEQAGRTRQRVVAAALELFVAEGFAAATVEAIAERAGVSRRTVFSAVGGKPALLALAFDRTLAGDDEPVPVADRPAMRAAMARHDPALVLREWVAVNAAIAQRIATLHHVVVVAADTEPDAAALLTETDRQRAVGNRRLVDRLVELGALRADLDPARAAAVADLLIDPALYRRLVGTHRWPYEDYVAYLQQLAVSSLLEAGP